MTRAKSLTLAQVIGGAIDRRCADLRVSMPARVLRYDSTLQQVDVQPLILDAYQDEEDNRVTEPLPVITNVPVCFPGAGGFRITFPIKAGDDGDTVLLVFSDYSLDTWLTKGGQTDTVDTRRHHLTDAVALVGLRDFAHALASAPEDRLTIGYDQGLQIHIDGTSIRIGDNEASNLDTAALGSAVATALSNILTALTTHTHSGVTTGPGTSGTSANASFTIPNVQSSKVKVAK